MLQLFTTDGAAGRIHRREWLRIGGWGALGALLANRPACAATAAQAMPGFGKAKSVIVVYCSGGQSQLETWDPKPQAPAEVRGKFGSIATPVPGVRLGELMPRMARLANRYTIVRTMAHDDLDHGTACYLALTGRHHRLKSANPPPAPNDEPTLGALLKRVGHSERFLYDAVHLNGPLLTPLEPGPGQDGGLLGRDFDPLVLGDVTAGPVVVPGLGAQVDLPIERLQSRAALRESLDQISAASHDVTQRGDMHRLYGQALALLESPRGRSAFDLSAEPAAVRARYGEYRAGQACLLARRLVEAGAPLVTVFWCHSIRGQDKHPGLTDFYGWDTHNDIFESLERHLMPRWDHSMSALLEDLEARGMLKDTLVICMGEFGRAPRVALEPSFAGSTPGRKHWAWCYSLLLAGAGITRGGVVGTSDRLSAYPVGEGYSPGDLAATLFSALGIDPAMHYADLQGRPVALCTGKPIVAAYR